MTAKMQSILLCGHSMKIRREKKEGELTRKKTNRKAHQLISLRNGMFTTTELRGTPN